MNKVQAWLTKKRFQRFGNAKVMVGQNAEYKRNQANGHIGCRKPVVYAILFFLTGILFHAVFIGR